MPDSQQSFYRMAYLTKLKKLWPNRLDWMSFVPSSHRPWILILSLAMVVLILLPVDDSQTDTPLTTQAVILQTQLATQPTPTLAKQSETIGHQTKSDTALEDINPSANSNQEEQFEEVDEQTQSVPIGEEWQLLTLNKGLSLSQLFSNNNLPIEDAIALTKATDKNGYSLARLQTDQQIKILRDNSGVIQSVNIELPNNKQLFYIRQADNSFLEL